MREIKFRAWEKGVIEDGETYGAEMHYSGGYGKDEELYEKRMVVISGFYHDSCWRWDNFEIMQFTGLKDSKGVEIWEGDIVKYYINQGEVVMFRGAWCMNNMKPHEHVTLGCLDKLEVIGNIHEHPQILKENDNARVHPSTD